MKLNFFGQDPRLALPDHLIVYILSLLDPESQHKAAMVSRQWKDCVQLTRKYISLLPVIHRIPALNFAGLDVLKFKLLAGGMTNTTYKLGIRYTPEQYVLRIPGKGSSAFIRRTDEANNALQAASDSLKLNVPVIHFDPEDGLQLTQFIKGVHPLDETALERKDILQEIAGMMKRLHSSEPFKNSTDFFQRNEDLLQTLKAKNFAFTGSIDVIEEQMARLKALFSAYQIKMLPCHNDTTPMNFILSYQGRGADRKEVIHEIDWEYSSNNDFLWDLVYFIVEAKLRKDQELTLLTTYFGESGVTDSVLAWVEMYKPVIEWWITIWSWTQVANRADAVDLDSYVRLGDERYQKTVIYLESREYKEAIKLIEEDRAVATCTGKRPF
ncbi:phosphotransferase family protein [Legionella shakespearei]|nr:phosphotransferase family protein [Legionella shakespearei]